MRLEQINLQFNSKSILNQKGPDLGIRLDIEKIKTFLALIGNPQDTIPFVIHIAGTNGKGSTLAFLEALLSQFSFRLGKYTSPHLISITERFSINGQNIEEARLDKLIQQCSQLESFHELTFFEKLTACAFKYFAEEKIDILLLETGLGGRLDATNVIIKPSICLISSIGLDHMEYLGNSIEEIAREKAGILKPLTPFVTTALDPALSVIRLKAQEINSPEIQIKTEKKDFIENTTDLGLKGIHQTDNALLAITAFDYLLDILPIGENINIDEMKKDPNLYKSIFLPIPWQGRFQEIEYKRKKIILDGAHNEEGTKSLRANLDKYYPNQKRIWFFGSLRNKDWRVALNQLLRKEDQLCATYATSPNLSVSPKEIFDYLVQATEISENGFKDQKQKNTDFECGVTFKKFPEQSFEDDFEEFVNKISVNEVGIVSGSLYLVGKVLEKSQLDKE